MAKSEWKKEDLERFRSCCPELCQGRTIKVFQEFRCPVSIVEADVKEYVIEEYESVELLILRLYEAGVTTAGIISEMTGIDKNMVEKILYAEIYTYGHIDPDNGEITETGRNTLNENTDIEKLFQHALYNVKRELQVEAVTGTIIRAEAEMFKDKMFYYSNKFQPNVLALDRTIIDKELKREINERLQFYIEKEYFSQGNTIRDIGELHSKEVRYRFAYYVFLEDFAYPFIAIPFYRVENGISKRGVIPTAIAESDIDKFNFAEKQYEYLMRSDACFEYLAGYKDCFKEYIPSEDERMEYMVSDSLTEDGISGFGVDDILEKNGGSNLQGEKEL